MPYTTNPNMPRVRIEAVRLVKSGWSTRKVARHTGFSHSSIVRWCQRAPDDLRRTIPTLSSRPHSHPRQLSSEMVDTIIQYRIKHKRCAEVLHYLILRDGYTVGLSSIKRVLKRYGLTRYSKWKKWHIYPPRPIPEKPGVLIQTDTIHDGHYSNRLYVYTLIDLCSRWTYAWATERISTHKSLRFIEQARKEAPFAFKTIQSDHGPEFSRWFTKRIMEREIEHRHSRVRRPTDNGHIERFNRTLQEECLNHIPKRLSVYRKEIPGYINHYNTKRPHMGLNMKTPLEVVRSY